MTITTTRNKDDSCTATHTELDDDGTVLWTVEARANGSVLYAINKADAIAQACMRADAERAKRGVQGVMG